MRQLSPITNLLLAICFSALSVFALTTPWYALAEAPSGSGDGAMEAIANDIYEFFTFPGIAGADALGDAKQPLVILAAVTGILAALMLVKFMRKAVRELVRFVPLLLPAFVLLKAVSHPAANLELRWGILAAFACAAFAASSAYHGAQVPEPKAQPKPYTPPPAGAVWPPTAER